MCIGYNVQLNLCKTAALKKTKNGFQDRVSLNAGQKYCRMLQRKHSAILSTFIKLPFVNNTFVLSIFVWPFYTDFYSTGYQVSLGLPKESVVR